MFFWIFNFDEKQIKNQIKNHEFNLNLIVDQSFSYFFLFYFIFQISIFPVIIIFQCFFFEKSVNNNQIKRILF